MARVTFNAGELDSNHQILDGIARALEPCGHARTTIKAVSQMDVTDDNGDTIEASLEQKIAYICHKLDCNNECTADGDDIIFKKMTK